MKRNRKLFFVILLFFFIPTIFLSVAGTGTPEQEKAMQDHGSAAQATVVFEQVPASHNGGNANRGNPNFPRRLDSYGDEHASNISQILWGRAKAEPFNLWATMIFLLAILHTFMTSRIAHLSHQISHRHEQLIEEGKKPRGSVNFFAEILHFFGEVEAVFGIWAGLLFWMITFFYGWHTATGYLAHKVSYTEPMFVVVIMILASSRPILKLAEISVARVAGIFGGSLTSWWMTILILTPLLGSFITEPATMTIAAMLLANKFYALQPSVKFRYATLGLLFVNVSVGGTLTHFAAPPVLMVAGTWNWGLLFMLGHIGWKAALGVVISTGFYYAVFRKELATLSNKFNRVRLKEQLEAKYFRREHVAEELSKMDELIVELGIPQSWEKRSDILKNQVRKRIQTEFEAQESVNQSLFEEIFNERFDEERLKEMRHHLPGLLHEDQRAEIIDPDWDHRPDKVPAWLMIAHLGFIAWTVLNAHSTALFIAGLLFFIGFAQATSQFQNRLDLKSPLLVGFFLAGLVIHGGLQAWWIEPILGSLKAIPLMLSATVLTAFNDNAAITFLSTLVPNFSPTLKYAIVTGAVTGGGLTVIANAPNPAGQAILKKYFKDGVVSPVGLLKAAIIPTLVMFLIFASIFG